MSENRHPVYFLPHYLNTSVFGTPTQTQFSTLSSRSFSYPNRGQRLPSILWLQRSRAAWKLIKNKFASSEEGNI